MIATLVESDGSSSTVDVAEMLRAIVVRRGDGLDLYVQTEHPEAEPGIFVWCPVLVVDSSAVQPPPPP